MTEQIWLYKHRPTPRILRIEWGGSTRKRQARWYERKVWLDDTKSKLVSVAKNFRTEQRAEDVLKEWVAQKLAAGFEYKTKQARATARASKPRSNVTAKAPRWLSKVDKRELARVRAAIEGANLSHRAADLESLLRPAIRLSLATAISSRGVTTRFGGDPDLPKSFAWPRNGDTPLAFVAQYRFDELAAHDLEGRLPKRGVLAVFAHLVPNNDGYCEVVKTCDFPDPRKLMRAKPPHAAALDDRPAKLAVATARVVLTLPPPDDRAVASLRLTPDEKIRYHDKLWLVVRAGRDRPSQPGAHQLLGWPDAMSPHATASWELLAQIDSDHRFGLELGDVETLRLFISTKKLAARDFRAVRASLLEY